MDDVARKQKSGPERVFIPARVNLFPSMLKRSSAVTGHQGAGRSPGNRCHVGASVLVSAVSGLGSYQFCFDDSPSRLHGTCLFTCPQASIGVAAGKEAACKASFLPPDYLGSHLQWIPLEEQSLRTQISSAIRTI